jgi:uncharacterized repeat protein (TIGR02543 family)
MTGYAFKGWSEASCGTERECTVTLLEDITVYARFEVPKPVKAVGTITSLTHPLHTCYIMLRRNTCDLPISWNGTTGQDTIIRLDDDEYYLSEGNQNYKLLESDPDDVAQATRENTSVPIYLSIFPGSHKVSIKNSGQVLDTVKVEAVCAPGDIWERDMCWQKDAHKLYVFKTTGVAVKSTPTKIRCGFNPEVCAAGFASSSSVTLQAVVSDGYVFDGWTGDCSGKALTCTIRMDREKSVGVKIK